MQRFCAFVGVVSSQLTEPSTRRRTRPAAASRRPGTIDLETQSGYKFGLAVVLGIGAVWASTPVGAAAAILIVAVLLAGRSLIVLAADPQTARALRPREFAAWDGALAATLALIALALTIDGAVPGAAVAGGGAIVLAAMRLRTRYVTK